MLPGLPLPITPGGSRDEDSGLTTAVGVFIVVGFLGTEGSFSVPLLLPPLLLLPGKDDAIPVGFDKSTTSSEMSCTGTTGGGAVAEAAGLCCCCFG